MQRTGGADGQKIGGCEAGGTGALKRGETGFAGQPGRQFWRAGENRQASGGESPVAGRTVHKDRASRGRRGRSHGEKAWDERDSWRGGGYKTHAISPRSHADDGARKAGDAH